MPVFTEINLSPAYVERFWMKVDLNGPPPPDPWVPIETGCWLWTRPLNRGQGRFWDGSHNILAHRYAYTLIVGPIPDDLTIDHLCRVTYCVNPEHLEPVPKGVNTLRSNAESAQNARLTTCKKGLHPLSGDNLIRGSKGERLCRECNREKHRRSNKRRWAKYKAERGY